MTTTTLTTTTTSASVVDRFLGAVAAASIPVDLYAPDAHLDAVVPGWRFAVRGGAAIAEQYGGWFVHPGSLEEVRRSTTAGGEVVEYTLTWAENGVPHAARHVHVLDIEGDRIVSDHVWCGGRWPADLLAEMGAANDAG